MKKPSMPLTLIALAGFLVLPGCAGDETAVTDKAATETMSGTTETSATIDTSLTETTDTTATTTAQKPEYQ